MTEKTINPLLKQILDLGPPILFFAFYLYVRDETYIIAGREYGGFILAAAVFVPILLASTGILWALTGRVSRMQVFTVVMVVFFGGLTVWFNDERFFKIKTTLVYGAFAAILGVGLLQGRSYLQWVMSEFLQMEDEGWMKLTTRLTGFFVVLAILNEIVWRTMSNDAWVTIETFAFPIAMFVFLTAQIMMLQPYLIEDEEEPAGED